MYIYTYTYIHIHPALSTTRPQEIYWAAGGKPNARAGRTFGEQVRELDVHRDGTCIPHELKSLLTSFGLSAPQADLICNYLVADNDKTCPLGERGLVRYQVCCVGWQQL